MKVCNLYLIPILTLLLLNYSSAEAQNLVEASHRTDFETYKPKVRDLIEFLEYSMNTIGNSRTPARDKNVIITQSYLKAFKDGKVQIEDDLNENREIVTHKSVQAYLSDIDFFFKNVQFEFIIDDISYLTNAENKGYYLVTMTRNLKGITIENDSINSNLIRYVEVNLNEAERDLKIASIYSSRLSEEEELTSWWQQLPYPWTDIFKNQLGTEGPVDYSQLQTLITQENLDLSNYPRLRNIDPVSRMTELKRIDVSGTQILDLIPLRNLTKLEFLNASNTQISEIEPLKYALNLRVLRLDSTRVANVDVLGVFTSLEQLSASYTFIRSLEPLAGLNKMRILNLEKTRVRSIEGLENLSNLSVLNISQNNVKDITPLGRLGNLQHLMIDNTLVTHLDPLKDLKNLRVLSCNNTLITTLQPLTALSSLERIYCDNTLMVNSDAKAFITQHPHILVVYGTESLRNWWNGLSDPWQKVLSQAAGLRGQNLTKEEMAGIANITRVDISGMRGITDLEPVKILKNLKELNMEATGVTDLTPVRGLLELEYLEASNTGIDELYSLEQLPKLMLLGIDNTNVRSQEISRFIGNHPNCLVMFKSGRLLSWWAGMSREWRAVLTSQLDHTGMSDKQRLHAYINLEKLYFKTPVDNLEPVREFIRLKELGFTGTRISDLEPLRNMHTLEVLRCSQSPVASLEPIRGLRGLKQLNFEDTLVDDLEPLEGLGALTELKFSGTGVKDLKPLRELVSLRELECYNTDVKNLKAIEGLRGLRVLKCYNTKINSRDVQAFLKEVPQCEVTHY